MLGKQHLNLSLSQNCFSYIVHSSAKTYIIILELLTILQWLSVQGEEKARYTFSSGLWIAGSSERYPT